ncbi:MAG: AbrB/MazE/SpoVT family DNA-binding domain-containing protein [Halanaerobiales bacterium]|nr:AbrB/MazE/SpoVT family DNA-binding domain-containing protein [Halanaerobiales bacterium]
MKSTGIVRKIDNLGRIVIPKELRKTMNLKKQDSLEIYVEGEKIIFKAYQPGCIFCGEMSDTFEYEEKTICKKCFDKMKNDLE